ncbi:unnamed protein product [Polarella glacialis]|uniref:Uncharacterized protein n=1 Tax=Polarella glacialis TaxID=89957 RepID=A0A813LKM1_POLGL|nr:unnamed protein product [Polarella glacialis]
MDLSSLSDWAPGNERLGLCSRGSPPAGRPPARPPGRASGGSRAPVQAPSSRASCEDLLRPSARARANEQYIIAAEDTVPHKSDTSGSDKRTAPYSLDCEGQGRQ